MTPRYRKSIPDLSQKAPGSRPFAVSVANASALDGGPLPVHGGTLRKMAALPEEPAEVVVKPDPEGGVPPQPPPVPSPAAPPTTAPAEGEAAGTPGSGGEAAPPKPAPPGPAASPAPTDRQTLLAVLQFLRRNNLHESEDILRREARLLGEEVAAAALSPSGPGAQGTPGGETDAAGGEALLSRVAAAAASGAAGGSVAVGAAAAPGAAAAVVAVPPGKGESPGGGGG